MRPAAVTGEAAVTAVPLGRASRRALRAGGPPAVLKLAREARGPVVEPAADSGGYEVTFVYADQRRAAAGVGLLCPALPRGFARLSPLGGGVFAATFRLPGAARVKYHFCLDPPDDLRESDLAALARSPAGRLLDRLNPSFDQVHIRGLRLRMLDSLLALPGARPAPPARPEPGVPRGVTEEITIRSQALGRRKDLLIYHPGGAAAPAGTRPAVLLLEGNEEWQDRAFLDHLVARMPVRPALVAAFSERSFTAKLRDFGRTAAHTRFIVEEVWPVMEQAAPIAAEAVLAGFSVGGLAAASLAAGEPGLFGRLAVVSGALHLTGDLDIRQASDGPPELIARLGRGGAVPRRAYLAAGWYEDAWEPAIHANTVTLAGVLRDRGAAVRLETGPTGHDTISARAYLAEGLDWLLSG